MRAIAIPWIGGLVLVMLLHMLLLHFGTHLGREGHRNALIGSILGIVEAALVFGVTWLFAAADTLPYTFDYICMLLIGCALLIAGIVNLCGLRREKTGGVIRETLSNVRITPAGYRNMSRKLEETTDKGEYRWSMLRGVDKEIADNINNSGMKRVTVTYHAANKRLESIF